MAERKNLKFVRYDEFDTSKLIVGNPQAKETTEKETGKTITYTDMPITYNYGTNSDPQVRALYVELPLLKSPFGLVGPGVGGKYSIMLSLPDSDPNAVKVIEMIQTIRTAMCDKIYEMRGNIKQSIAKNRDGLNFLYSNPIYSSEGRPKSMYIDLMKYDNVQGTDTKFIDLDENEIEWVLLKSAEVHLIPLLRIDSVYIGSKANTRIKLKSAVVESIVEKKSSFMQAETARSIKERNPDQVEALKQQLAMLRVQRANQPENNESEKEAEPENSVQSSNLSQVSSGKEEKGKQTSTATVTPAAIPSKIPKAPVKQTSTLQDISSEEEGSEDEDENVADKRPKNKTTPGSTVRVANIPTKKSSDK